MGDRELRGIDPPIVIMDEAGSLFDQEVDGLERMMGVYEQLRAIPSPPKEDNSKPKRRAASKRARKARRNRG